MALFKTDRRLLLSALIVTPFGEVLRTGPALAQTGSALPPLVQPPERTKAGFLARARALRDQAVREGDQAYGAVVVRDGVIVGEGRNYVVLHSDPTAHAELLAVRDAARRLNRRDLSDCDVYSTATPARCARVPSIGPASAAITMSARRRQASRRNSPANETSLAPSSMSA
jgi:pyrimidine deaminase RibD-like protein